MLDALSHSKVRVTRKVGALPRAAPSDIVGTSNPSIPLSREPDAVTISYTGFEPEIGRPDRMRYESGTESSAGNDLTQAVASRAVWLTTCECARWLCRRHRLRRFLHSICVPVLG